METFDLCTSVETRLCSQGRFLPSFSPRPAPATSVKLLQFAPPPLYCGAMQLLWCRAMCNNITQIITASCNWQWLWINLTDFAIVWTIIIAMSSCHVQYLILWLWWTQSQWSEVANHLAAEIILKASTSGDHSIRLYKSGWVGRGLIWSTILYS